MDKDGELNTMLKRHSLHSVTIEDDAADEFSILIFDLILRKQCSYTDEKCLWMFLF